MKNARNVGSAAILVGLVVLALAVVASDATFGRGTALIDRWFFSVGAVAAIVLGECFRRGAITFGILAFLLTVGGASQLYLTDPLWFPALHLKPQNWKEYAVYGVIAVEALAALAVLLQAGPLAVLAEARDRLGLGRLGLFAILTAFLSVPIIGFLARHAIGAYFAHIAVSFVLVPVHLLVMAAMTQVKSPVRGLHRLSPLAPATVALIASLLMSLTSFEAMPHVEDEVAYLFQARTFAGGALTTPAPPEVLVPGLDYYLLDVQNGRWFAATSPGWPAVLALGVKIGAPWIVNPILAALSVLLAFAVTERLAGRDRADIVALMMGTSPWLLAMAGSLMTHTLTLFLMLLAWWMILRAAEQSRRRDLRLLTAGAAMGLVFCTRPLDGLIAGGLTGLWLLFGSGGATSQRVRRSLPYAIGCVAIGSLLLIYNHMITGGAFTQPSTVYLDKYWAPGANSYGFGANIGPTGGWGALDLWPGHSPLEALINTLNMAVSLQFDLMGWPIGSLALVLAFFLWQRPQKEDRLMLTFTLVVIGATFFYWFADSYYIGPRYWFMAAFPLFYLSARGYQAIRERFPDKDHLAFLRIDAILVFCCVFGLAVFLPWRGVTKYYEYGDFNPTVREDLAAGRFKTDAPGGAIVVVTRNGDPGGAIFLNDPWLRGTIFLNQEGKVDMATLRAAFPDREVIEYKADWSGL